MADDIRFGQLVAPRRVVLPLIFTRRRGVKSTLRGRRGKARLLTTARYRGDFAQPDRLRASRPIASSFDPRNLWPSIQVDVTWSGDVKRIRERWRDRWISDPDTWRWRKICAERQLKSVWRQIKEIVAIFIFFLPPLHFLSLYYNNMLGKHMVKTYVTASISDLV